MIVFTKYIIATGQITGNLWVTATDDVGLNDALVPPEEAFINGYAREETAYIQGGEILDRPILPLPATYTIAPDTDLDIPDIPEGTSVEIDGEEVGIVDASGLTLSFAAAGVWPVTLRPPFPWIDASCEVVVS